MILVRAQNWAFKGAWAGLMLMWKLISIAILALEAQTIMPNECLSRLCGWNIEENQIEGHGECKIRLKRANLVQVYTLQWLKTPAPDLEFGKTCANALILSYICLTWHVKWQIMLWNLCFHEILAFWRRGSWKVKTAWFFAYFHRAPQALKWLPFGQF